MRSRLVLCAGIAGICLAPLGAALPATAAPAAPVSQQTGSSSSSTTDKGSRAVAPITAVLKSVSPTTATVVISGAETGSFVTVVDGHGMSIDKKVYFPDRNLVLEVPVKTGAVNDITVTQTVDGETSAATHISVDTNITSLSAPRVDKVVPAIGPGPAGSLGLVRVSGVPFLTVEIRNSYGALIGSAPTKADGTANVPYKYTTDLVDPRLLITQSFGDLTSPTTMARTDSSTVADDLARPAVTVSEEGDFTVIRATVDAPQAYYRLFVRDAMANEVARVPFVGRTATYKVRTPEAARLLRVSLRSEPGGTYDRESLAEDVVLAEGSGSDKPSAPIVDSVATAGSGAVATIEAVPGAVVTVRDSSDKIVGVKAVGSSSTVSVRVPGSNGLTYSVTQTTGSRPSDPASFQVD